MAANSVQKVRLRKLILELKKIQGFFLEKWGVDDIYSNSKIFEILIANELNHILIPGHSGSKDAKDESGNEFEYKHFKETSGNHSWTFNDYSDTTIEGLKRVKLVIFAHIDDTSFPPKLDWYICVDGEACSDYLKHRTEELLERKPKGYVNKRKMINFSAGQLEKDLNLSKTIVQEINRDGSYYRLLIKINNIANQIEKITGVTQILTSNKFWELLVSLQLGHQVLSEQAGHYAVDIDGNFYEYKVSKSFSWNFQDISENVLNKYTKEKAVILAVVDKEKMDVVKIFVANSKEVVRKLKEKLTEKADRYASKGGLRRLQVSLSHGDIKEIGAKEISSRRILI